jgi:hypothetical protein
MNPGYGVFDAVVCGRNGDVSLMPRVQKFWIERNPRCERLTNLAPKLGEPPISSSASKPSTFNY